MTPAERLFKIVGPETMQTICNEFGGERIYIPHRVPDPRRDLTVIEVFDSELRRGSTAMSSYQRAAETVGISVRRAQQIIAKI